MNTQKLPSFWSILWVSLVLCLIGWGGLVVLIYITLPTLAPRWLFFFLLTLAMSGIGLPIVYFLNRRFPASPPVVSGVVLREGMWFGVYGSLLSWLQMGRVLTPGLAMVLAVGLILVEFLLRLSEHSQWPSSRTAGTLNEQGLDENEDEDDEEEDE